MPEKDSPPPSTTQTLDAATSDVRTLRLSSYQLRCLKELQAGSTGRQIMPQTARALKREGLIATEGRWHSGDTPQTGWCHYLTDKGVEVLRRLEQQA